ncbi:MAG: efflux RND transporter permease subunit, partial [Myxococcota bacterium]
MLVTLGLRTGLLVASLIPMTMIASLMLMNVLDIGLDRVSLAALIIALGMLVDNAIVMAESIMVNLEAGKSRMDAAVEAAAELQIPLLVSSMTTSAAFLPIYLAESAVGEFTSALFEVVSIALLCSWTLALTMIPLLCKAFMKVKVRDNDDTGEFNSPFYRAYRAFLVGILKQRVLTVVIVGSLFVGALSLFRFIPNVFFPPDASTYFTLELTMAPGTAIETTEETVLKVEQFIIDEMTVTDKRTRGVTTWGSFIGQGAPKFNLSYTSEPPTPSYAILLVNISHAEDLAPLMRKLEVFCLANIPGSEVKIRGKSSGPPVSTPIEVRVFGPDRERVFAIVDTIKAQLTTQSGTKNIRDNWGMKTKKLVVDVASERARRAGVTNQDVAISLMTVFSGFKSTEFREGTTAIPVQLRSVEAERQDLAKIEELNITNQNSGNSVPLLQVADVDVLWQPSKILRRDRRTAVSVLSDLDETVTATEVNNAMLPWLEEQKATWGTGYNYELGG